VILPQGGGRAAFPHLRAKRPFSRAAGRGGSLAAVYPPTGRAGNKRPALGPAARSPHTHLSRAPAASPGCQPQTSQPGTSRRPGPGGEGPSVAGVARLPSSSGKPWGGAGQGQGQGQASPGRPPCLGTSGAGLPQPRRSPQRGGAGSGGGGARPFPFPLSPPGARAALSREAPAVRLASWGNGAVRWRA